MGMHMQYQENGECTQTYTVVYTSLSELNNSHRSPYQTLMKLQIYVQTGKNGENGLKKNLLTIPSIPKM